MKDEQNIKQKKHAYQRKNPRMNDLFIERKQARNTARPKQRFLGIDSQTGLGLGWTRAAN
jgi:hypothetical protein